MRPFVRHFSHLIGRSDMLVCIALTDNCINYKILFDVEVILMCILSFIFYFCAWFFRSHNLGVQRWVFLKVFVNAFFYVWLTRNEPGIFHSISCVFWFSSSWRQFIFCFILILLLITLFYYHHLMVHHSGDLIAYLYRHVCKKFPPFNNIIYFPIILMLHFQTYAHWQWLCFLFRYVFVNS